MASAQEEDVEEIQEESGARVNFTDKDTDHDGVEDRTICIRGDSESAQKAEVMIRQFIADMPTIVTEEVQVPVYCLGRLIGRGGENIRQISRSSHCKIFIDRAQDSSGPEVPRVVTITGSSKDIQLAKTMIEEKVNEEEEFRNKMTLKGANREQRKGGGGKKGVEETKDRKPLTSRVVENPETSWDEGNRGVTLPIPGAEPVREFMEVFVSAVEHAGHFWLQMVSRDALNLDTLTDHMSLFYSNSENDEKYRVKEVKEGEVVAAPFSMDKQWYRARVEGFEEGKVDMYYFDFGDNELIPLGSLRELKPDYLSLPVQAIECKLANVKPTGEAWSDESSEAFEQLTHCAEWKILSARTLGYLPLPSGQRPCVQLVDNEGPQPLDVAEELVSRGLAVWENPPSSSPPSDTAAAPTTTTTTTVDTAASDTVRPELVPDSYPS